MTPSAIRRVAAPAQDTHPPAAAKAIAHDRGATAPIPSDDGASCRLPAASPTRTAPTRQTNDAWMEIATLEMID
jgi:hypothetical protein